MIELTMTEKYLLHWLAKEDFSQYGECHGKDLDSLVAKGLAQIHGAETERENTFIAKGDGIMFRAVSLTEAGYDAARRTAAGYEDVRNDIIGDGAS